MKKLPKIKISQKPRYIQIREQIDFFDLFQKIERNSHNCFIFESLGEEGKFSRYSVIGFDPDHIISARGGNIIFDGKIFKAKNPYFSLRKIMPEASMGENYTGGLVGYMSYEALNYFEFYPKVKIHESFDPCVFGVYTDGLILDKVTNELVYFYHNMNRLPKLLSAKNKKSTLRVKFIKDSLSKKEYEVVFQKVKKHIEA